MAEAFSIGGGVQDLPGAGPRRVRRVLSNVEQEQNEISAEVRAAHGGRHPAYPRHVYKPGGLTRIVATEAEFGDHLEKGWVGDIRDVVEDAPAAAPDRIHFMSIPQALAAVAAAKDDPVQLAALRADEESHGNRKVVLDALRGAEDEYQPLRKAKRA